MAELIHPTKVRMPGPFLVPTEGLEELDQAMDKISPSLEVYSRDRAEGHFRKWYSDNEKVAIEVERSLKEYGYGFFRTVTVEFKSGRKLEGQRFGELIQESRVSEETPVRTELQVRAGDVSASVSVRTDWGLEISALPEGHAEAKRLFEALQGWAEKYYPGELERLRRKWEAGLAVAVFLLATMWLISHLAVATSPSGLSNAQFKEEGRALLQRGLGEKDQQRALELILALACDYDLRPTPVLPEQLKLRRIVFGTLDVLIVACILLMIGPGGEVGIGYGKKRIERWRMWLRFRAFIFVAVILEKVLMPLVIGN